MMQGAWDDALQHHEGALALNPNDPRIIAQRGELLTKLGRADEGVEAVELAMRLDPFEAGSWAHLLGRALLAARRYREAIEAFRRIPVLRPDHHADVAACAAMLGDAEGGRPPPGRGARSPARFLHRCVPAEPALPSRPLETGCSPSLIESQRLVRR